MFFFFFPLAVKEARSLSGLTIQQQDNIDASHDQQDPHRQTNPAGCKAGSPRTGDGGFVHIQTQAGATAWPNLIVPERQATSVTGAWGSGAEMLS